MNDNESHDRSEELPVWDLNAQFSDIAQQTEALDISRPWHLESFPQAIVDRCWQELTDTDWNAAAARILLDAFRGRCLQLDRHAIRNLKKLLDVAMQHEAVLVSDISHALTREAYSRYCVAMREQGHPDQLRSANAMYAIELCFFGPERDTEMHLFGGLALTAHRVVALDAEPTGMMAAMFALREAYAYFMAGEIDAAKGSLKWAEPHFASLNPEVDTEQSDAIAQLLFAAAFGAKKAEDFDAYLELLLRSQQFRLPRGDDCANCHYFIGQEYERRRHFHQAIPAYHKALETPKVEDPQIHSMANMALSMLRAELESDPSKLVADKAITAEFGGPPDFLAVMQHHLQRMLAGVELSDDEELQMIEQTRQWIDFRKSGEGRGRELLWFLVFTLKMCLSLKDQRRVPVPYPVLLRQAETYLAEGDAGTVLKYQEIKELLASRNISLQPTLRELLADLRKLK